MDYCFPGESRVFVNNNNEKYWTTINELQKGDKVKVTVWIRGREMIHQQLGGNILKKVEKDLMDIGKVEFFTK